MTWKKIDGYKKNPEKSSATKVGEHIPSGFVVSKMLIFKSIYVFRGKDCMKKFCESLRKHVTKMIYFEKKKKKVWTAENLPKSKNCYYICKEKFNHKNAADKKSNVKLYSNVNYTDEYRGGAHIICNLKYSVPKESPWSFHANLTKFGEFYLGTVPEFDKFFTFCLYHWEMKMPKIPGFLTGVIFEIWTFLGACSSICSKGMNLKFPVLNKQPH